MSKAIKIEPSNKVHIKAVILFVVTSSIPQLFEGFYTNN